MPPMWANLVAPALLLACSAEPTASTPKPAAGAVAAKVVPPAPTPGAEPSVAASPKPTPRLPLTEADQTRIASLMAKFAGGKKCDVEALAQLRQQRDTHQLRGALGKALALAFKACEETVAMAQLMADAMPEPATAQAKLKLGAAWLRAARYPDAIEVLEPLATDAGQDSKAAWLTGFALFHAGRPDEALPWLQGGRGHVGQGNVSDAPLLIGLSLLHAGDTEGAIAELEAGVKVASEHPGLLGGLSRAYEAAGRHVDSRAMSERAAAAATQTESRERTQLRLAALSNEFAAARGQGKTDEADAVLDTMLTMASGKNRTKLLGARVELYTEAGRTAEAAAAKKQLDAETGGVQ